jgi:hypothetical protein
MMRTTRTIHALQAGQDRASATAGRVFEPVPVLAFCRITALQSARLAYPAERSSPRVARRKRRLPPTLRQRPAGYSNFAESPVNAGRTGARFRSQLGFPLSLEPDRVIRHLERQPWKLSNWKRHHKSLFHSKAAAWPALPEISNASPREAGPWF